MHNWKKYNRAIIPDSPPHFIVKDSVDSVKELVNAYVGGK